MLNNIKSFVLSLGLLIGVTLPVSSDVNYIWWEGESPVETNFPKNTWFANGAVDGKRHLLSNQAWLTNEGERRGEEAFARYKVEIPEAGEYQFWVRKFWKHGPFRWRFEDQDWRICSRDISLADSVTFVTHISANWVSLGSVTLPKGELTFELRLLAEKGESLTACFDCFLLTQMPFVPRGPLKPDEKSGLADEGFFPWEPGLDPFTETALLDLGSLNEPIAGQSGFIKKDQDRFIRGDGEPIRFWAVNLSSEIAGLNRQSVRYLARKLAKQGVNMVRYHSPLFNPNNVDEIDSEKLDDLFFLVHALKQEGIYTKLSFYFPLWFSIKPEYGIEGYQNFDNKRPFALLYFNERMQEIYKSWAKGLLTTKNPYTNKSLANDPAVAIVEIINEDSYFFWTFTKDNIPPVHWQKLELLFADWLVEKYGSLQSAYRAWNNRKESADDLKSGRIALYDAWHMTGGAIQQANSAKKKRVGDQVQFLTEHQYSFYQDMKTYFKEQLGAQNLISTSNWHVSDPSMLGALERYTYTAGDVIDRHGYFSGPHNSPDGRHSYAVDTGHTFENLASVTVPAQLPLQFIQINDYPHIISEIGWTNPNLYRADFAFLASAYGSLQGIDGIYTFAIGGAFWDTSMEKFAASCPVILGNFPAYALLYRRGDVKMADPVIHQHLKLDDLYAMKGSGDSESQALDDLRLEDVPPGERVQGEISGFDPLSFYVGRVLRSFSGNPELSTQLNLTRWIDRTDKTVSSQTGELRWNYGDGLVTINTPKSQGATGFLNQAGKIELDDVVIDVDNEFASILLITLDNQPIHQSKELLLQTMTVERPYGFEATNGDEGRITNMGSYPFGVEKIDGKIQFKDADKVSINVIPLDPNGYPQQNISIDVQKENGLLSFKLAEDAIYHLIRKQNQSNISSWRRMN